MIVAIETPHTPVPGAGTNILLIKLASLSTLLDKGAEIVCIAQLGCEDLESVAVWQMRYELFEIEEGRERGMVRGQGCG